MGGKLEDDIYVLSTQNLDKDNRLYCLESSISLLDFIFTAWAGTGR